MVLTWVSKWRPFIEKEKYGVSSQKKTCSVLTVNVRRICPFIHAFHKLSTFCAYLAVSLKNNTLRNLNAPHRRTNNGFQTTSE